MLNWCTGNGLATDARGRSCLESTFGDLQQTSAGDLESKSLTTFGIKEAGCLFASQLVLGGIGWDWYTLIIFDIILIAVL